MKLTLWKLGMLALTLVIAANARAEFTTDVMLSSGYQANLFNDSNASGDTYASAGLKLQYYPSGFAQFSGGASYSAFATFTDLSNLTGEIAATVIPTSVSSRLSVALSGNITSRSFGISYEDYNRNSTSGGVDAGFRLSNWMRLQLSTYLFDEDYANSDYGSNHGYDATSGIYLSLPGSNALSVLIEYSRRNYDQPALAPQGSGTARVGDGTTTQAVDLTGLVFRFSRPLGTRTGVNVAAGYRQLYLENQYAVLGYTIDYLSPWSDLWEGASISAGLKRYFAKQVVAEISYAYYDKNFVDVVEYVESDDETYLRESRSDRMNLTSLSLSRPVSLTSGKSIIPTVNLGYRSNVSSLGLYSYDDVVASVSIKVSM